MAADRGKELNAVLVTLGACKTKCRAVYQFLGLDLRFRTRRWWRRALASIGGRQLQEDPGSQDRQHADGQEGQLERAQHAADLTRADMCRETTEQCRRTSHPKAQGQLRHQIGR